MQEYFICVGLIFLPIGIIIAYLLNKEGLPGKYIAIIEFVAFLIILSFPISMEKLGTIISLAVYIALLIVTALFFLPGRRESTVIPEGNTSANLPGERQDYLEEHLAASTDAAEICTDSSDLLVDATEKFPVADKAADEITANEYTQDEILKDSCQEVAYHETVYSIPDVTEALPEENEVDSRESQSDAGEHEYRDKFSAANMDTINDIASKKTYSQDQTDEEPFVDEDNTSELSNDIDARQVDEAELSSGIAESMAKADDTEELTGEAVVILSTTEAVIDTGESESKSDVTIENEMIYTFIDRGFKSRSKDFAEAAGYFEQAWQLTINQELKHLLTLELCQIYKELGEYRKAEGILEQFSVLVDERPDIIEEINEQLTRVKLLVRELNRLGLGDIPLANVPRFIRLKIAEENTTRGE